MIQLQQDEYEHLLTELHSMHETVLQQVENYVAQLDGLVVPEGGFHADLISEKVRILLEVFKKEVVPQLEGTFQETEKSIKMFGEKLEDIDESGRTKVQWEE